MEQYEKEKERTISTEEPTDTHSITNTNLQDVNKTSDNICSRTLGIA
jgi:hypothetical protein